MTSTEEQKAIAKSLLESVEHLLCLPKDCGLATPVTSLMAEQYAALTGVSTEEVMYTADDFATDNGVAISPVQAAKCLKEPIRTQQFIKGVKLAIEDVLEKNEQVSLLYAGTGPYALPVLPLIALYFRDQALNLCLVDIHERNVASVKNLVQIFDIEERVFSIEQADASQWEPKQVDAFDIIVSETMTAMLRREPQVKIFAHLEQFLKPNGKLIPEEVVIKASLVSGDEAEQVGLGHVFTLSRDTAKAAREGNFNDYQGVLTVPSDRDVPTRLCLDTEIRVYGNIWLTRHECSLNLPVYVEGLYFGERSEIPFYYDFSNTPDFVFDAPYYTPECDLSASRDEKQGSLLHLRRFWHKVQLDKASMLEDSIRNLEFELDFSLVNACSGDIQEWYSQAYQQHPPCFESFESWVKEAHALDEVKVQKINEKMLIELS